ncbi:MAG: DUF1552 domain-containing protein [Planctomycetota bacterium]
MLNSLPRRLWRFPANRRRVLRGLGVALTLPLLDCHRISAADRNPPLPRRMLLISNNLGVLPGNFFPADSGAAYSPSLYLRELAEFRSQFTVFSGLSHPAVTGGHSTENCFLTAARDPTRSGFRNTISLDQFAVESLGRQTRFPTLNLGVNIDKANRSLSWTRDGALLPAEDSPAKLYQRMFLQGDAQQLAFRLKSLEERASILDVLRDDVTRFQTGLGTADRARLDQYLTSVRELEHNLATTEEWEQKPKPATTLQPPTDVPDPALFFAKIRLMLQMARLAFDSDSTRIVTLMIDGFATPVLQIDDQHRTQEGYHGLSHHGQSPQKLKELEQVDLRQMQELRQLFSELAATSAGDNQNLLDRTMILFGSNMGDANVHSCTNLPILLAGGQLRHGHHLVFDGLRNTPLCNLFVTMLLHLGVEQHQFASSSGIISELFPPNAPN